MENLPFTIDYKEAIDILVSNAIPLPAETVELRHSLNRVLAEDVFFDSDMPPFNKSAMDGYACRRKDLDHELEVVETLYAGKLPEKKLEKNQCYKIMTGAVVPEDADVVFKKEEAKLVELNKVVCTNPSTGNNICYRGEDIQRGDKILEKSIRITSRHLPLLAGAGIIRPQVYSRPEITVFATGTELVEPDTHPLPFQIRNSNSSQLLAQLSEVNISAHYGGIIKDDEAVLTQSIDGAFENCRMVILTGGVSVGDFDLIPEIVSKLGFEILISATSVQPGKPMIFARKGEKYCFGLSGNPVSSFIQFELYVKTFLLALMGHTRHPGQLKFPLGKELNRKNADRLKFIPCILSPEMEVVPVEFHGSAHISALSEATHLLEFPKGVTTINKGESVNVRSI